MTLEIRVVDMRDVFQNYDVVAEPPPGTTVYKEPGCAIPPPTGRRRGRSSGRVAPGTAAVHHFGLRGGTVDIRFRALVDSRGAFGKARARHGILKAGIGVEGHDRDLEALRVGTWYEKDDIPATPLLLPEYEAIGAR